MAEYKILVVDDEEDLREILTFNLLNEGYKVESVESGEAALELLSANSFDLILLDVMMGGMSGFKVADKIKEVPQNANTPIIFLTAKITENDMLTGFSLGADDYITKPFSIKELTARVKAVLKRCSNRVVEVELDTTIKVGLLTIDTKSQRVYLNEDEIILTIKEYEILALLAQSSDRLLSRQEILDRVWRDEAYVMDRTVDVHIARIRKKIASADVTIINRSGYGYSLKESSESKN